MSNDNRAQLARNGLKTAIDRALATMRSPGTWAAAGLAIGSGASATPTIEPARAPSETTETEAMHQPHALVLVDPGVADAEALLDGLPRRASVLELPGDGDPIAAITQALRLYPDVAELHVLSHGEPGALLLSGARIDGAALVAREEELRGWFADRENPPAIVLYGCSTAAGESGLALIETLSSLTGAPVSASDDPTGDPDQGGDWLFERSTGLAARAPLFSDSARAEFEGLLATFTVDNTDDDGAGSLRQAVLDANAAPGADEIVFDASLNNSTITLTGAEIEIDGDVSITGPGAAALTIDGDANDRIFNISGSEVRIEGVTLTGGNASAGNGGAIFADYTDLTIVDSVISGNSASSRGGGISAFRSDLRIENSVVSMNSAGSSGGGIFVASYYGSGSLDMLDSTISDNQTTSSGGGVAISFYDYGYGANPAFDISNSVVTGNSAARGGGISLNTGTTAFDESFARLTIEDSTISQNDAEEFGGGIRIDAFGNAPDVSIQRSTISENEVQGNPQITRGVSADGSGGGIAFQTFSYTYQGGSLSVSDTTITENTAPRAGGGVFIGFEYATSSVSFRDSIITSNSAGDGLQPINPNDQRGSSFPPFGGGIALLQQSDEIRYDYSRLLISGTTIASNSVEGNGGGIGIVTGGALSASPNPSPDSSRTASNRGIDFYAFGLREVRVQDTTISGNQARIGGGVAIGALQDRGINFINSTISGNTASLDGGGIAVAGAYASAPGKYYEDPTVRAELEFVTIADNQTDQIILPLRGGLAAGAGGVSLYGSATLGARNSIIGGNSGAPINDVAGPIEADFSLIEDPNGATITGADNLTGVSPALAPLADNGGPTLTHLPTPASPAIGAGDPGFTTPPNFDQRGEPRISGGAVDMGSVEVQGAPPELAITPSPAAFGDQKVGTTSAPITVTLSNGASAGPLQITAIDPATAPFTSVGGDCSPPLTLNADESCTLEFTFAPTATGPANQTITISSDDPDGPTGFDLTGNGTQGALTITPDPVDFGGVDLGTIGGPLSATLENTGDATATITSVGGPTLPFGAAGGSCGTIPFDIPAGDSCTLDFTFAPLSVGAASDSLEVESDAGGSPDSINLAGIGVGLPTVSLSTQDLDFGLVSLGVGETDVITLTNTGSAVLQINSISDPGAPFLLGFGARGATQCPTPPFSLVPSDSCQIEVAFAPPTPGTYSATFDIQSNAPSSPDSVSLRGSANSSPLAIPVLGGWATALMAALLGLLGLRGLGTRRRGNA